MAQFTIYTSADSGAPVLTSNAGGELITVLDGVLINGYTASITSITRSGSVATVTTATNHNLFTGNSTTIAGANETDYNGTFTITRVSDTVFTYTVPGAPATPATGTITWKKLGAGWTKPFTGTNKAAYLQGVGSNGMYLRVQDDGPHVTATFREAHITGYETMTGVDTGSNPFPTAAQGVDGIAAVVARKSANISLTARAWIIAADSRTVYMFITTGDTTIYWGWAFGEFFSFKANDNYRTMIIGRSGQNSALVGVENIGRINTTTLSAVPGHFFARGHTEAVGSVNFSKHGDTGKKSLAAGGTLAGVIPYTNPEDGVLYLSQLWINDPATAPINGFRGRMRGFWHIVHPVGTETDRDIFSGGASGELSGKTFIIIKTGGIVGNNDSIYILEVSNTLESN